MTRVRLKIDLSGTIGTAAWDALSHYEEAAEGRFGPDEGARGPCSHEPHESHGAGEWFGAVILLDQYLLAEYAVAHYLEQPRVLDAYVDGTER